jgi:hypothetical protein
MRSVPILCVAAALVLPSIGLAGADRGPDTLASTKRCLLRQALVQDVDSSHDAIASKAIGGALEVSLRTGNSVAIGFFRTPMDAANKLQAALKYAKTFGIVPTKTEAHTVGTALVGWSNEPTKAEVRAVEGCIR